MLSVLPSHSIVCMSVVIYSVHRTDSYVVQEMKTCIFYMFSLYTCLHAGDCRTRLGREIRKD